MKIAVHDYAAFAFPVQLSRELARRGHQVLHLYSDLDPRGGRLAKEPADPATFDTREVSIGEAYQKYDFRKRAIQEWKYWRRLRAHLANFAPDVVFSCNAPITVAKPLQSWSKRTERLFVNWTQDILSLAARSVLPRKLGPLGRPLAGLLRQLEARTIRHADATIVISEDFAKEFEALRIRPKRLYTIPNWMPLDEMKPEAKDNAWARRHALHETLNIMYVGMLGFKHDSRPFLDLARHFAPRSQVRIVVVGGGLVFDELRATQSREGLANLMLLPWQAYAEIASIFAAGDVLLALIAPDASRFSVPCKVLSYLSAGRPVLACIPADNLMHRILTANRLGLTAEPGDSRTLLANAERLLDAPDERSRMAARGRKYAEENFDISAIGNRFEAILAELSGGTSSPRK